MKYYLKSLFVNPWVLSGTVMYWNFSENKSFITLTALISLLFIFHLFDFKKIKEKNETALVKINLSFKKLIVLVAFNALQSNQLYLKASILLQLLNIIIICSMLIFVLVIGFDVRYTAPTVFLAPFILTYIFLKLGWITFYTID